MSSQPTRVGSCVCFVCGIKFCWSSIWLLALLSFTSERHHLELNLGIIIGMWFCFSLAQILPRGLFSLCSIYATSENIHRPLLFSVFISQSLKKSSLGNKLCLPFPSWLRPPQSLKELSDIFPVHWRKARWCGSVGGASRALKGHQFNSRSGHSVPALWAWFLVGGVQEAAAQFFKIILLIFSKLFHVCFLIKNIFLFEGS